MKAVQVAAAVLLASSAAAAIETRADPAYLGELVSRSRDRGLSEDRFWHRLGHYRRNRLGLLRSEAAGRLFFLSASGKKDPRAELEATLAGFFAPPSTATALSPLAAHPQCRFPLRYEWLKARLGFDLARLPEQDCPDLRRWRETTDAESATLIFASAFLNSPSSMYGHTFLRLDRKGRSSAEKLLDTTLNFAAETGDANPLTYALFGLAGLFPGKYSAMPYYLKVQEYSNLESRDIWEYRLNLSSGAVERLVLHAWELGDTHFPYFFFNKNCSYQLLPLLEVAEPRLEVTPAHALWVIPADTVRALMRHPGMVADAAYRPSQSTKMRQRRALLEPAEARIARDLGAGPLPSALEELERLAPDRLALSLDAASELILFKTGPNADPGAGWSERETALLRRRSRLAHPAAPLERPPWAEAPHVGHDTARIGLGAGVREKAAFQEIDLRAALHDLLDPTAAYVAGGSLEMGHARLRRDAATGRSYLKAFRVMDAASITPWDSWTRPVSWRAWTGVDTADELDRHQADSLYYGLSMASGFATAPAWTGRSSWYLLAEGDAGLGGLFRNGHRIGAGGIAGGILDLFPGCRLHVEGRWTAYALGDAGDVRRLKTGLGISPARNFSIRLDLSLDGRRREMSAALQRFL